MNSINNACVSAKLIDLVNNPSLKLQHILDHTMITQNTCRTVKGAHQHLKTVESCCRSITKHAYIILTPLNPTFI